MKEKVTQEQVAYIANLAKLPLSEKEKKHMENDLSEVIDFNMGLLDKVDTEKVDPTTHISGISGRMRKDETEPGLNLEESLQNAKEPHNGFFKVKAILGESDE